jgi:hypothetical protein
MAAVMPAAFFGHGNPMNALETNRYTEAWHTFGRSVPQEDPTQAAHPSRCARSGRCEDSLGDPAASGRVTTTRNLLHQETDSSTVPATDRINGLPSPSSVTAIHSG